MARPTDSLPVTLDARMARHTGIGRYIRALCGELADPRWGLRLRLLVPAEGLPEPLNALAVERIPFAAPIYSLREQWQGSRICRRQATRTAVWHFPHYNAPWTLPRNSVVTIHDMTHFTHAPQAHPLRVALARRLVDRVVRRAGRLVTPTEGARLALESLFSASRGKTVVVPHGVDAIFRRLPGSEPGPEPLLLYVGNDKPHKNLPRLLEAFAALRPRHPRARLVLAGKIAQAYGGEGVELAGEVSDAALVRWYNRAVALVLPSLNEGFGLTALEALACGTPVVGAAIPPIREVVGDAGLLVDPRDVAALAQALARVLENATLRAELGRRAVERARVFRWQAAAERIVEIYRDVGTR